MMQDIKLTGGDGMNVKTMIKKAPFCLGITLLSALFLIHKIYFVLRYMRQIPWIYVLVCAVPLLLFGSVYVLRVRGKMEKNTARMWNILIAAALVGAIVLNFVFGLMYAFKGGFGAYLDGTSDVGEYRAMLWQNGYPSKSMCHFPKKIPKEAKNVSFWENPQFLQGSFRMLLMYETTEKDIAKYRKKYEPLALAVIPAGEQKAFRQDYYMPDISVMEGRKLTDDFEVILLDGTPIGNHGYSRGLAVNEKTNEILFFREIW